MKIKSDNKLHIKRQGGYYSKTDAKTNRQINNQHQNKQKEKQS